MIYFAIAIGSPSSFAAEGFELLAGIVGAAVVIAILIAAIVVVTLAVLRIPPLRVAIRVRLQSRGRVPERLSWLAGTALHMEAFGGSPKAGDPAAVTAMLGAQLGGAGVRRPLPGVDLATTPYRTSSVLDDIAEAVKGLPRGTALAALIKVGQKLLPRYDMYLTGYLLQSPQRGSGLVLSIVTDAGTVTSSGALWADILEPRLGWPEPGYGAAPKTHADARTAGGDGGSGPPTAAAPLSVVLETPRPITGRPRATSCAWRSPAPCGCSTSSSTSSVRQIPSTCIRTAGAAPPSSRLRSTTKARVRTATCGPCTRSRWTATRTISRRFSTWPCSSCTPA